ncbi:MAG: hypothetical protein COT91_01100 [Candidatus Doudnabacteria bacterium CG10_big_fil_rev_8_21_14_0_10_41_10]|uniref:Uncharacterized protein n=1 Tax=Candidatus Doudnabacteria bacterium CG10_big_fil_rev_8_21_14_0_10_41_10 TaxID=1974551 RepID=A0A2H0VGP5_9BACT|nr:MAG: hypothetical protein COT91_01100 [Candidatus Doudnabacteria bacterium CG10_big_fil_rev_8_21_14_0_10_41_10]
MKNKFAGAMLVFLLVITFWPTGSGIRGIMDYRLSLLSEKVDTTQFSAVIRDRLEEVFAPAPPTL